MDFFENCKDFLFGFDPNRIEKEKDKKTFVKLFGEYLRTENVLQNYDKFAALRELQNVDAADEDAMKVFQEKYYLSDEDVQEMRKVPMPSDRAVQDYRSTYNDIRDWLRRQKAGEQKEQSKIDWDDLTDF